MKVLWLVNVPLPEASLLMKENMMPFGGWLVTASKDLAYQENIELTIIFPKNNIKEFEKFEGERITYYAFKEIDEKSRDSIENNLILKSIIEKVKPDIVHIYGTELAHTLAMVNVCNKENIKTIISIQGLVSIIEKHIFADLPFRVIYGFTFRNLIKKDNIIGLRNLYHKRGKNEIKAIKKVSNIIGRTTWDKACVYNINNSAKYYFCNETLREEFYKYSWDIEKCEKYSIFLSQGQYPIKGLHYLLEAMSIILEKFPQTKLYISGKNIIKEESLMDKLLITYYGKYIKSLIKKLNLENNVIFTGPLNEEKMCDRFLKSHVFVSSSTIENESNSLSEARILGVPSIASYVGGVTDRVKHKYDGFLYQHNAPYMLAYYVCKIFNDSELAINLSKRSRKNALENHDRKINTKQLMNIYSDILK